MIVTLEVVDGVTVTVKCPLLLDVALTVDVFVFVMLLVFVTLAVLVLVGKVVLVRVADSEADDESVALAVLVLLCRPEAVEVCFDVLVLL